jgi:hypothetical protein
MLGPADARAPMADLERGIVSAQFYEAYCRHASRTKDSLTGLVLAAAPSFLGRLANMIRRSTAPLSWAELQRAVSRMNAEERVRFAAAILGSVADSAARTAAERESPQGGSDSRAAPATG